VVRKYLHSAIYQGKLYDNIVIVGATPAGMDYYETINKYYYYGYKCIGFLDNQQAKMNGCAYFGKTEALAEVLRKATRRRSGDCIAQ
jgi:putative colanic acid biosynthesis UDP-glucose lipid carrier transferase